MQYIADLHLHSHYAYATSKNLNLDTLYQWGKIKGLQLVATGDFTHPAWYNTLQEKLQPLPNNFFTLKNPPKNSPISTDPLPNTPIYFILSTEVSCIYKYNGKVRKNHHLIFAPNLDLVKQLNQALSPYGNLAADGRPILKLSSRDLLEIVLNISKDLHLIPAHIWTPWFSSLGEKSGYDSIKACFRDLTDHIFALETGLSSDILMNQLVEELADYTFISNSDAHSPQKLAREANLFNTELSYQALFKALKTKNGFQGTFEFFPQEGKYYFDGHKKCKVSFEPQVAKQYQNICPVCKKRLTQGVLHRLTNLTEQNVSAHKKLQQDFHYIIPLVEIIAEIHQKNVNTKFVSKVYAEILHQFQTELNFLYHTSIESIQKTIGSIYAEAIRRLRHKEVSPIPGFDGEFGIIRIFSQEELKKYSHLYYE